MEARINHTAHSVTTPRIGCGGGFLWRPYVPQRNDGTIDDDTIHCPLNIKFIRSCYVREAERIIFRYIHG